MTREKIDLVEGFKRRKVLIIGDGLLDTYVKGTTDKICREAPVPVFSVVLNKHECGGAANTAINVSLLGAEACFLSVLGKDANARFLIDELKQHKVHTGYIIQDKSRFTLEKKRIIAASNILLRIDEGTTNGISAECEKKMLQTVRQLYAEVDAIILSDYGYGTITAGLLQLIQELTTATPKAIIVDAKDLHRYKMIRPTVIKPNYEEAIHLLKTEKLASENRVAQIIAGADELMELTGAEKAAVTLDVEGVVFIEKDKNPYRILCVPHENSKAIGAGDTFISALGLSLAAGAEGCMAAEIAAAAAAVVVQKEGTAGCTNDELKSYLNATPKYISSVEGLTRMVAELRKKGKRIVFANGCFDIIHKGHITLLNKARQSGDVLIVGVNSDASIRKLKGAGRPINRLEDRIMVLSGLTSVDYIIAFEEETPVRLIKAVHPDVFIKGGDYSEATIREAPLVKKLGGIVKIIPYLEDHSTTHIINKLRSMVNTPAPDMEDLILS